MKIVSPSMKNILFLLLIVFLAGCASTATPFNPSTAFNDAEGNMQKANFEKARKLYQEIQEKSPDRSYDAAIMLRIADTYFGEEKYEEALVEYQNFLNYHPVSKDAGYAQYQIAMCSFLQLTTIDRDPEPTRTALKEFQKLVQRYPGSIYQEAAEKNMTICRDRLSEYELYVGRFYFRKKSYRAAVGRFDKLLQEFPDSASEKDALYYKGMALFEMGEKTRARTAFETLVVKYPSMLDTVAPLMRKVSS
jgi:outer membrane protein assembly factor BamD